MGEMINLWAQRLILLGIILSFLSCSNLVPKRYREDFTLRYPQLKKSTSKIRTDGFYSGTITIEGQPHKQFNSFEIFFDNGLVRLNFSFSDCDEEQCLKAFLKDPNPEQLKKFNGSDYWGLYKEIGDTIYIESITHSGRFQLNSGFFVYSDSFLVNQDSTICILGVEESKTNYSSARFVECDVNLIPKPWILREKWIWKSDEDYRRFRKNERSAN